MCGTLIGFDADVRYFDWIRGAAVWSARCSALVGVGVICMNPLLKKKKTLPSCLLSPQPFHSLHDGLIVVRIVRGDVFHTSRLDLFSDEAVCTVRMSDLWL